MKVVVTGGGTAGHIYPALSVAALLDEEHDEVTFVGAPSGLEARLVREEGVTFYGLAARGFDRSRPWTLLTAVLVAAFSTVRAWRLLGELRPDVVIGFGAYVSIPVGIAAALRQIPLVLHEQNSIPGLANRLLSRWATAVGITYEESLRHLAHPERVEVSGNPVRAEVLQAQREVAREAFGIRQDALVLLVFGGSRGARHINTAVVRIAEDLLRLDDLVIVHATGPAEFESVSRDVEKVALAGHGRWKAYEYLPNMGEAIAAADLVVCRAGATTIAELAALGAPAVIVPYPYATDDHQRKNAAALVEHGAAVLVDDSELDTSRFGDEIRAILSDPARRATMSAASSKLGRRDAAHRVVAMARRAAAGDTGETVPLKF